MKPSRLLLAALFVAALLPRLYHVRSPYMSFADHNTANFSIFARNYLDRGLLATRLGQARNVGPADAGSLEIFAHHPPTIALAAAAVFSVFGVSEPAARALPAILSAATCPLLFLVASRMLGPGFGLLAAGLFAAAPGAVYYGAMLDHEAFVAFLGLAAVEAWARSVETGDPRWRRTCLALVAATALVDWPGEYLAPALLAAAWIAGGDRRAAMRFSVSAVLATTLPLAAAAAHIVLLEGSAADLSGAFVERVASRPERAFTWGEYLHRLRLNLEYALTPPGLRLAVVGGAAAAAAGLKALAAGAAGAAGRRPGRGGPPSLVASLAAALAVSGWTHHLIFTDACHSNEHLVYYLLPSLVLLAAAAPAVAARALARVLPGRAAGALALAASLVWIVPFAAGAPEQIGSYFNEISAPGWPLLGRALARVVPEEGAILTPGTLANPQFLHYAWRTVVNDVADLGPFGRDTAGAYFVRDVGAPLPPALESRLAGIPYAEALGFTVYDLAPGPAPGGLEPLSPAAAEWRPVEIRFGDALLLALLRIGPDRLDLGRPGLLDRWLGVPWTPETASGRIVHASFVWERLEGDASELAVAYTMSLPGAGRAGRAPRMWPPPARERELASLAPGATARHEVDWFAGEWLPEGEYRLHVEVKREGRLLPPEGPGPAAEADRFIAGTVAVALR